ncbi:MAG: 8-oxo-dGTP diphosphatase [Candidatus Marsarchaeota archaeon]|nr:8-oxo-dGTP diphosphatase [Candidatus Marsarchaeota archaeon]
MDAEGRKLEYYEGRHADLRDVTLCYPIDPGRNMVLIAMKKRGFGVGKWNGSGGKCKEGESVEDALKRETEEELGIKIRSFRKVGVLKFFFTDHMEWDQKVHVFLVDSWDGDPVESEEMRPKWHRIDGLPFKDMWPDDEYWLLDALSGKKVRASFLFDSDNRIIDHRIENVESL